MALGEACPEGHLGPQGGVAYAQVYNTWLQQANTAGAWDLPRVGDSFQKSKDHV